MESRDERAKRLLVIGRFVALFFASESPGSLLAGFEAESREGRVRYDYEPCFLTERGCNMYLGIRPPGQQFVQGVDSEACPLTSPRLPPASFSFLPSPRLQRHLLLSPPRVNARAPVSLTLTVTNQGGGRVPSSEEGGRPFFLSETLDLSPSQLTLFHLILSLSGQHVLDSMNSSRPSPLRRRRLQPKQPAPPSPRLISPPPPLISPPTPSHRPLSSQGDHSL